MCVCVPYIAGLPDEAGRLEILNIHTSQMKAHGKLDKVDLDYLASKTRNFSGAEIEGLVRSAQATAMNKIIKVCVCVCVSQCPIHCSTYTIQNRLYIHVQHNYTVYTCPLAGLDTLVLLTSGQVQGSGGSGRGRESEGYDGRL